MLTVVFYRAGYGCFPIHDYASSAGVEASYAGRFAMGTAVRQISERRIVSIRIELTPYKSPWY